MRHERFTPTAASWLEPETSRRAVWAALLPRRRGEWVRLGFAAAAALADFAAVLGTGALLELVYQLVVFGGPVGFGPNVQAVALIALFVVVPNAAREAYSIEAYRSFAGHPRRVVPLWIAASVLVLALGFVTKTTADYSRALAVLFFVGGLPGLLAARYAMVRLARRPGPLGQLAERRVHLVGFEEDVEAFHRNRRPDDGLRVVGTSLLRRDRPEGEARRHGARFEEDLALAVSVVRFLRPDDVFVLVPWSSSDDVERCVNAFLSVPVALHLRPEQVMNRFAEMQVAATGSGLSLNVGRRPLSPFEVAFKRAFDVAVAGAALVLLAPVLGAIALLIRLDSRGPALFVQHRHGFNQEPFRVLKFRSMRVEADAGFRQATRDDDRITRVGRLLRRYNLDELPQLWNVIRGDMSLVGPRPHALAHDRSFERRIALYARRHNVKPGITGWAQVNGLRGETLTDEAMRARVEHDLHYIDHWSPWLDLKILVATVISPRAYRNAY
jgi:polysaccharide biosynthesis protein PslA